MAPNLQPALAPNAYVLHRAPETTASSTISVVTDIYQAGLTLFRLTNGIGLVREQRNRVGDAEFERLKALGLVPAPSDYQPFVAIGIKRIVSRATSPNPTERFQSALEMRRALERLQFGGHWDIEASGGLFGVSGSDRFTFDIERKGTRYSMVTYRESDWRLAERLAYASFAEMVSVIRS